MKLNRKYIIIVIISIILLGLISIYFNSYGKNKATVESPIVLHTVVDKQYQEVFFSEISGEMQQYQKIQQEGISCSKVENTTIGGDYTCGPVSGYQHIYQISNWHLLITGYENTYSSPLQNPGIFSKNDPKPFILSGNGLYQTDENNHTTSIQYFEFKTGESQSSILSGQGMTNVTMIASSGSRSEYTFINPSITIDEGSVYIYYFDTTKPYYYLVRAASSCPFGVCGIDQHHIGFFSD